MTRNLVFKGPAFTKLTVKVRFTRQYMSDRVFGVGTEKLIKSIF